MQVKRKFNYPDPWKRVRQAVALSVCVWTVSCSDMKFLVEDFSPGEAKPLTMEVVTLHNYKEDADSSRTLEFMRIHGQTAEMVQTPEKTEMEIRLPEVFFYDQGEPNSQVAYLRSEKAILHLKDDETSSPAFLSGDIDFIGDVVYLNRAQMMRLVTDQARYSSSKRLISNDSLTTRTEAVGDSVALDIMRGGFSYNLALWEGTSNEGDQQENLEGPEAEVIQRDIYATISAIPWVSGPDDTPIPVPPLAPLASSQSDPNANKEETT